MNKFMCQDILIWLLPSWTALSFYFCYIHGCVYCITEVVVQLLSCVWLLVIPWTAAHQTSLFFTISQSLSKFMSIESVMPSNLLILYHPLLLLPAIFPSIRVFSNDSALHIRWPKYWSFNISPSNEYSGLIYFSIDWFDLLAAQGTQQETFIKIKFPI